MSLFKSKKSQGSEQANLKEGTPSLSIALSTQRHGKKKKMALGGAVESSSHSGEPYTRNPGTPAAKPDDKRLPKDEYMADHFAEGGEVEASDLMSDDERAGSIAEAILRKRKMMADGGMVDLESNSEEKPNAYYDINEDTANEEQYDDGQISAQPEDSNEKGDDIDKDKHDMVSAIRRKLRMKSGA